MLLIQGSCPKGSSRTGNSSWAVMVIQLRGFFHELKLLTDDRLPLLTGQTVTRSRVALAPLSITFLAITKAGNRSVNRV